MAKIDHKQVVVDKIIAKLESGVTPWQKAWNAGGNATMPRRINGEYYKGINVLLLMWESIERGFNSPYFMTYRGASSLGGQVRKGSKSSKIFKPKMVRKDKKDPESELICNGTICDSVFNVDLIDGLPAKFYATPDPVADTGAMKDSTLESFFKKTGADIATRGNQPCYIPALDRIEMPPIETFESAPAYYGILAHETIHWTGHKTRMDRKLTQVKTEYAYEELIAELGALITCTIIGATPDFDNSAAYIESWLKALRNDKGFIFNAARDAQKAVDYLIELTGTELPESEFEYQQAA